MKNKKKLQQHSCCAGEMVNKYFREECRVVSVSQSVTTPSRYEVELCQVHDGTTVKVTHIEMVYPSPIFAAGDYVAALYVYSDNVYAMPEVGSKPTAPRIMREQVLEKINGAMKVNTNSSNNNFKNN